MSSCIFSDLEKSLELQPGEGRAIAAVGLTGLACSLAFGPAGYGQLKMVRAARSIDQLLDMAMRTVANYILAQVEKDQVSRPVEMMILLGLHLALLMAENEKKSPGAGQGSLE
jgi:hypothetical protein